MAQIVVVTHRYDEFYKRRGWIGRQTSRYMIDDVLTELKNRRHSVAVVKGIPTKRLGDVAIMHVDATFVSAEYIDYGSSFPLCLNLGANDISKRKVSAALLEPDEQWNGPVIVKTNLNARGVPEWSLNERARRKGHVVPFPGTDAKRDYQIFQSRATVPSDIADDPELVVERFMPEVEKDGFALRIWVFCGEAERCTRYVSPKNLVKARDTIRREAVSVPDDLRKRRRELKFDYGKFDFVVHDGQTVLLDANKTPTRPSELIPMFVRGAATLADGFERLIKS